MKNFQIFNLHLLLSDNNLSRYVALKLNVLCSDLLNNSVNHYFCECVKSSPIVFHTQSFMPVSLSVKIRGFSQHHWQQILSKKDKIWQKIEAQNYTKQFKSSPICVPSNSNSEKTSKKFGTKNVQNSEKIVRKNICTTPPKHSWCCYRCTVEPRFTGHFCPLNRGFPKICVIDWRPPKRLQGTIGRYKNQWKFAKKTQNWTTHEKSKNGDFETKSMFESEWYEFLVWMVRKTEPVIKKNYEINYRSYFILWRWMLFGIVLGF